LINKGDDKEEYVLPCTRESIPGEPAGRMLSGKDTEGSFGTGRVKTGFACRY